MGDRPTPPPASFGEFPRDSGPFDALGRGVSAVSLTVSGDETTDDFDFSLPEFASLGGVESPELALPSNASPPPYSRRPGSNEASGGIQGVRSLPTTASQPASTQGHVRRVSEGLFSRAEQGARAGIASLGASAPDLDAEIDRLRLDEKRATSPAPIESPRRQRRELKGGELLGTLKIESGFDRLMGRGRKLTWLICCAVRGSVSEFQLRLPTPLFLGSVDLMM